MKAVGRKRIDEFCQRHADVRSQLASWLAEAEEAEWYSPMDVKERYPSASFLGGGQVVFNIKGNKYRLDTKISYKNQVVLIRRIGTHAEYDEWIF
jgi:mRNA interferase HigB